MEISLVSLSNAPSGWLLWRQQRGWIATIVTRATFVLGPGEAVLAPEQEPLERTERASPQGGSAGLYAPCDLVPMKPRVDVVLVGSAFAPGGAPARSLVARLAVGGIDKHLAVACDRWVGPDGAVREGTPFMAMPLVYERAPAGPLNPIGVRGDVRDRSGSSRLPNLTPAAVDLASGPIPAAVGLGPVGASWPQRRARVAAAPVDWNGHVLAADFDPGFFQAAPPDQQLAALRADERVVLEHLHPRHAELSMELPGVRPLAFATDGVSPPNGVPMRADTLWIDTNRAICTVTWRGRFVLDPAARQLRIWVRLTPRGEVVTWRDVERMTASASPDETLPVDVRRPAALPFPAAAFTMPQSSPTVTEATPFRSDGAPADPIEPAPDPVGSETLPLPTRRRGRE